MQYWRVTMDRPWVIVGKDAGKPRFPVLFVADMAEPCPNEKDDN